MSGCREQVREDLRRKRKPASRQNTVHSGAETDCSCLEVELFTGKTHQIRAHLAAEGHPIIGDYKYGMRSVNDSFKREYGLSTQLLHSCRLCFPECTGALSELSGREITAPVPDLFRRICREKGVM